MCALIDFNATSIFVNRSFVEKDHLNTYKLSRLVLVYNIDRTFNKGGQILKMIYIVL